MVADGNIGRRVGRRARRGDAPDPATDGNADQDRRTQQSDLRRLLRQDFPQRRRDALLPILHLLQHEHGHLPEWALQVVGWHLRVPASEIYGAATSYSELRLDPPAARHVTVCTGLACWMVGGDELLASARDLITGVPNGSVSTTACAFLCSLAPAVRVDGRWTARTTTDHLRDALAGSPE